MVTDPIQRQRSQDHESELDLDAHESLLRLAALPPSIAAPYLTVCLDWRPDGADPGRTTADQPRPSERRSRVDDAGASRRPSRHLFEREATALPAEHGPRGDAFDSLSTDIDRISDYLDAELDPSSQGVFIVACSYLGIFEPLALGLPLSTQFTTGPIPALAALARLAQDYPVFATLLADQHDATLSIISQATRDHSVTIESSDYPRKQKQGGWSQQRFQARAGERVAAFARGIADATLFALDEMGVDQLVIAGDEVITSALDAVFHQRVKDRIVGTLRLDIGTSDQDLIAATLPLIEQGEREREAAAVEDLSGAIGAGGLGVGGVGSTLTALQSGQASTLVVGDDFAGWGWADYEHHAFGAGDVPAEHPLGGDVNAIVPVRIDEELIRLALQTGADVVFVHSAVPVGTADEAAIPDVGSDQPRTDAAAALDALGGVGAILRFTFDGEHPTADQAATPVTNSA